MELLLSQKLRPRKRRKGKARWNDAGNFHGHQSSHRTGADKTQILENRI
jgi:hypothetical protein